MLSTEGLRDQYLRPSSRIYLQDHLLFPVCSTLSHWRARMLGPGNLTQLRDNTWIGMALEGTVQSLMGWGEKDQEPFQFLGVKTSTPNLSWQADSIWAIRNKRWGFYTGGWPRTVNLPPTLFLDQSRDFHFNLIY